MAGLYFHIPFCKRVCAYCDFYKSADLRRMDDLLAAMHRELDDRRGYPGGEAVTTRYFGGGTPSLCTPEAIRGLLDHAAQLFELNFWATWCPPCRQELARVQSDVIDRFAGRDFVFLPISRGETHQTVAAFREKTGYSFPMGLDPSQTVYDRYASNYIPRNFVIDRNGKVVLASVGYDPEEFDEMIKTIEKTLE